MTYTSSKWGLAALLVNLSFLIAPSSGEQPNLLVILADDCTYRDIGCYGGQAATPNIDQLADEGMKFERCFQAAPMCSPTRHNLYTGLYPVKSGAYPNHTMVYPDVKTVAHYLKPLGYRVVQTGKLHVNPRENFPWERIGKGWSDPTRQELEQFFVQEANSTQPFCLFVCFNSPHGPWNKGDASAYPPAGIRLPPYIVDTPEVRENFARYLAEVTYFDHQVGDILESLDRNGLDESTVVVVLSEQGNSFPFAKWTCYDHGLQSAMIVRWPEQVESGTRSDAMVEYVDITPTLIDLAGGEPIVGLDGKSFAPVLRQESDHHKDHVFGIMTTRGINNGSEAYAIRSIRSERYKLILNLNHESKFKSVTMQADFYRSMIQKANSGDQNAKRLVDAYARRPPIEFYDMQSDQLESENLANVPAHAQRIADLKAQLEAWMASQGDLGLPIERSAELRQPKHTPKNRRYSKSEIEQWITRSRDN